MPINEFSKFKEKEQTKLTENVFFRKVGHSISQNWHGSGKTDKALTVASQSVNAATALSTGATIAIVAGATTGAFVTVVAAPLAAAIVGVTGLGLVGYMTARSVYSDRDGAHEKLGPHVWSLIDDLPPEKPIWEGAACINGTIQAQSISTKDAEENMDTARQVALYLMTEGQAQFKLMGPKLKTAQDNFDTWWNQIYEPLITDFVVETSIGYRRNAMDIRDYSTSPDNASKARKWDRLKTSAEKANKANKAYTDSSKQGRPLFEYMRCIIQTGNYLQCANIVHYSTFVKLNKKTNFQSSAVKTGQGIQHASVSATTTLKTDPGDMLIHWDMTTPIRETFTHRSDRIKLAKNNMEKITNFFTTYPNRP